MDDVIKATRSSGLISKKGVRQFLLEYAERSRAHRFARVSPTVFAQIEAVLREQCRRIVHGQPSRGKTIR
jgi:hypothetical protein